MQSSLMKARSDARQNPLCSAIWRRNVITATVWYWSTDGRLISSQLKGEEQHEDHNNTMNKKNLSAAQVRGAACSSAPAHPAALH